MGFDVEKWLIDGMGYSAEEAKELAPKLASKADRLEKGVLMQADYSRKMDEIKTLRTEVDTNNAKLTADMAEWAELTAAEKREAGDLKKRIEEAETRAFALEKKLTRVAEENGLDAKELLGKEPTNEPPPKRDDPKPYDDAALRSTIGGVAEYMMTLAGDIDEIADEHLRLTGEKLNRREFVNKLKVKIQDPKAKPEDINPRMAWEREFDIPTKRAAFEEKRINGLVEQARAEGRSAAMSEGYLPGSQRPAGEHSSPVFKTTNVTKGSVLQRPQPSTRLQGAVNRLAKAASEGKVA